MRVVVVREYTDKYTGEGHVIGEKLDMTEERFAEIQDKGMFVVDISDEVVQQESSRFFFGVRCCLILASRPFILLSS